MSLAFHHHAILVSDLERAEAFYGGVLGLPIKKRWLDDQKRLRSLWFGLGDDTFMAVELHEASERPDFGHHCFALAIGVDEQGEWRRRLAAADVTIEKESGFSLYFRDPEGNQIALSHWPQPRIRSKPSG